MIGFARTQTNGSFGLQGYKPMAVLVCGDTNQWQLIYNTSATVKVEPPTKTKSFFAACFFAFIKAALTLL